MQVTKMLILLCNTILVSEVAFYQTPRTKFSEVAFYQTPRTKFSDVKYLG